jgi:hypothetical protein
MSEWPKKENPADFLHKSGLLYRINREILHPLGLAMAIEYPDTMEECNGLPAKVSVYYVDDEDGILFEHETMLKAQERAVNFMQEEGQKKILTRQNKLGFVVQPLPKKTT